MFEVILRLFLFTEERTYWRGFTRKIPWPFPWLPRVCSGDYEAGDDVVIPDGDEGYSFTVEQIKFDPQGVLIFELNQEELLRADFDRKTGELQESGWVNDQFGFTLEI